MSERTIGKTLRLAMLDQDMRQEDLAVAVGLSRETVSKHVRGVSTPNLDQLIRYAHALGCRFEIGDAPAVGLEPTTYRFRSDSRGAA